MDIETGEETLKLADFGNQEKITVHLLVDPDGQLVKAACLYLYWNKMKKTADKEMAY